MIGQNRVNRYWIKKENRLKEKERVEVEDISTLKIQCQRQLR